MFVMNLGSESDELSETWLKGEEDTFGFSSETSSPESLYDTKEFDELRRRCRKRRESVAQKAILERAYKFIEDEIFSSETTTDSDSDFDIEDPAEYSAQLFNHIGRFTVGRSDRYVENYFRKIEKPRLRDPFSHSWTSGNKPNTNRSPATEFLPLRRRTDNVQGSESARLWRRDRLNVAKFGENRKSAFSSAALPIKFRNFGEPRWMKTMLEALKTGVDERGSYFPNSSAHHGAEYRSGRDRPKRVSRLYRNVTSIGRTLNTKGCDDGESSKKDWTRNPMGKLYQAKILKKPRKRISSAKSSKRNSTSGTASTLYRRKLLSPYFRNNMREGYMEIARGLSKGQRLVSKMRKTYFEKSAERNEAPISRDYSSSSDDNFTVEVEKSQENWRYKGNRLTIENLENKQVLNREFYTIDCSKLTEVKLLEDIKKRIDEDFEKNFQEIETPSESGDKENRQTVSSDKIAELSVAKTSDVTLLKSSGQNLLESIDSGVSTDFSRNASDLWRPDGANCTGDGNCLTMVESSNDSLRPYSDGDYGFNDEMLDEQVERAVRRFTEELIMCERRAIERGLVGEGRRGARNRKKTVQQAPRGNCGSPITGNAFSRRFSRTSVCSSGEEEYLENISPPSLCSISDSEIEDSQNLYD